MDINRYWCTHSCIGVSCPPKPLSRWWEERWCWCHPEQSCLRTRLRHVSPGPPCERNKHTLWPLYTINFECHSCVMLRLHTSSMTGVSFRRWETTVSMRACSVPHWTSEWMVMAPRKWKKKVVLLAVAVATCSSCRSWCSNKEEKISLGLEVEQM